jgi:hypothetical protein
MKEAPMNLFRRIASFFILFAVLILAVASFSLTPPAVDTARAAAAGWQPQDVGQAGLEFWDIQALSTNVAYGVARDGWVVRTVDGGASWTRLRGLPGG